MTSRGEPFFFRRGGDTALLLIHGWSSTPQEIRELGEYLAREGFTVRAPMLKGHGTHPDDLGGIKWEDWRLQLEEEYSRLAKDYKKVWVGGSSLGGNLSLLLAGTLDVAGVIALATPLQIRFHRAIALCLRFIKHFKTSLKKRYPPHVDRKLIDSKEHYWSYPISSMLEALSCIAATSPVLPQIKAPALIMQSDTDHMLSKKNAEYICEKISSRDKRLIWVPNSYHVFTIDHWREEAFKEIAGFIRKHNSKQ